MNISVFCASSDSVKEEYRIQAKQLGNWIARNEHTLVYGGATGGLMQAVALGASELDGEILGIIPDTIIERGRTSDLPTQLFKVSSMSERKAMMIEYSDLFVVLPGGFGTLDEFFDTTSSCMVNEHDKYTILYNPDNYWEGLIMQIERMKKENLAYNVSNAARLKIANSIEEIFSLIETLENK